MTLWKYNIPHEKQFSFQEGKSTEHVIFDLYTNIIQSKEKQKSKCIFPDFAKAFDAGDHCILIRKLEHYEVRGMELEWGRIRTVSVISS